MFREVTLPLWLFVLIVGFAAVTFASHFLFPSVRWFFRRRAERVVERLNKRLPRPIEPFKLARRSDMLGRLTYDPEVVRAVVEEARAEGIPEPVAWERARRYAREIVPAFSATAYFGFGTRLARWLARSLYRVRIGAFDREAYEALAEDRTLVFVMNHRSNMDYMLVTYLTARASALSYAVGEWARVWPLRPIIKMMGGYFIRRKSRGQLYRTVLRRYVQMATENGVTQAMFPEGGLSVTGGLQPPRLGLLNYIVEGAGGPDSRVVFVPVALNYDRVLEDRILIAADAAGERRFRPPLWPAFTAFLGHLRDRLLRRFKGFGTVTVSFGTPYPLADLPDPRAEDATERLGQLLMGRVAEAVAALPVPLVATAFQQDISDPAAVRDFIAETVARLKADGRVVPRRTPEEIAEAGLALLAERGVRSKADDPALVAFYARSIAHLLPGMDAPRDAATRQT